MKRGLFILLTLLTVQSVLHAANTLSVGSVQGHPGDTLTVSVSLTTTDAASALQITLPLDDELSYVDGSAVLATGRLSTTDHQLAASFANGQLTLLVYSTTNASIPTGSGPVLSFRLRLGNEPAAYALKPVVVLSNRSAQKLSCQTSSSNATILSPKIQLSATVLDYGHVAIRSSYTNQVILSNKGNEALHITSLEVSSSVWTPSFSTRTIAAGSSAPLVLTYSPQAHGAESAIVTIASDAVNGSQKLSLQADPYSVNELHASSASGESGSEVTVTLQMSNMESIVAMQCAFELPQGVNFVEGSAEMTAARSDGHVAMGSVSDSRLTLFAYNAQNKAFLGTDGDLLRFRLLLSGKGGTYSLPMQDAVLSNLAGDNMLSASSGSSIRIYGPEVSAADSVALGRIPVEEPFSVDYPVRNAGEAALTIDRVSFTDSLHWALTDALPLSVAAGETSLLRLTYTPSVAGEVQSVMQLYSNDPTDPMLPVVLSGTVYESDYLEGTAELTTDSLILSIALKNTTEVVALQMDLRTTDALSLNAEDILLSSRTAGHAIALTQQSSGTYRLFIYSLQNKAFSGHDGELLRCGYRLPSGFAARSEQIMIDNIIMSTASQTNCATQQSLTITAGSHLLGDANSDGVVTITDVVAVINHTLEREVDGFSESLADMNQDGMITVSDAVLIIHHIMNN